MQATPVRDGKRYAKALLLWLAREGARLPMRIQASSDRRGAITLRLLGYPEVLRLQVRFQRIEGWVCWQGQFYDYWVDIESDARCQHRRFHCAACDVHSNGKHHGKRWGSARQLWVEHDFEAFAELLHDKVAAARWLYVVDLQGSHAWAEFSNEPKTFDPKYTVVSWRLPGAALDAECSGPSGAQVPSSRSASSGSA